MVMQCLYENGGDGRIKRACQRLCPSKHNTHKQATHDLRRSGMELAFVGAWGCILVRWTSHPSAMAFATHGRVRLGLGAGTVGLPAQETKSERLDKRIRSECCVCSAGRQSFSYIKCTRE